MSWKLIIGLVIIISLSVACSPTTSTPVIPTSAPEIPTPTMQPTNTAEPPTQTKEPTATNSLLPTEEPIPAGWASYSGIDFNILLPETYKGGGTTKEFDEVIQFYRDKGQNKSAEFIQNNDHLLYFYAVDTQENNSQDFFTYLMVFAERPTQKYAKSAENFAYMFDMFYGDPACKVFWSSRSSAITIPGFDAWRQVVEHDCEGTISIEYLLKEKDDIWFFVNTTQIDEMEDQFQNFETSITSFQKL